MATKRQTRETQTIGSEDVGSLESLDPSLTKAEEEPGPATVPEPEPLPTKQPPAQKAPVPEVPVVVDKAPIAPPPNPSAPVVVGPACPKCGSGALGVAGGMNRCNQCGHSWE
jgi:hypothetical protein